MPRNPTSADARIDRRGRVFSSRRAILRDATLALSVVVSRGVLAGDQASQAAEFIHRAGTELGEIARMPGQVDARRDALKAFLDRVVDTRALAEYCLGRFWASSDPAWRQRYVALFESMILLNVLARIGSYRDGGTSVAVDAARPVDADYEVPTVVSSVTARPAHIHWRVSFATGSPRIVDVSAEGISLRVTLRSDFTSFLRLADHDFGAFLDAMRHVITGYFDTPPARP
jgi:phospholipid transport system substrate-binding protein